MPKGSQALGTRYVFCTYFIVLSLSDLNINMAQLGIAKCFKKNVSVGDSQACVPAKKPRKSPPEKQGSEYKIITAKIEA